MRHYFCFYSHTEKRNINRSQEELIKTEIPGNLNAEMGFIYQTTKPCLLFNFLGDGSTFKAMNKTFSTITCIRK